MIRITAIIDDVFNQITRQLLKCSKAAAACIFSNLITLTQDIGSKVLKDPYLIKIIILSMVSVP